MSLAHDIAADYPDFEQALLGAQSKLDASHILRRGEGEASVYSSTSRGHVRYDLFRRGDMWHWERKGPLSPSLPEGVEMIPDVLDLGWDPGAPMRVAVAEEMNEARLPPVVHVHPPESTNKVTKYVIDRHRRVGGRQEYTVLGWDRSDRLVQVISGFGPRALLDKAKELWPDARFDPPHWMNKEGAREMGAVRETREGRHYESAQWLEFECEPAQPTPELEEMAREFKKLLLQFLESYARTWSIDLSNLDEDSFVWNAYASIVGHGVGLWEGDGDTGLRGEDEKKIDKALRRWHAGGSLVGKIHNVAHQISNECAMLSEGAGGREAREEASIPTKAQLKIINAFRERRLMGNPMRDSISTDGDTIYSYRMPIAGRNPRGGVWIIDPASAPSATTRNHVYGLQRTFTPAEIMGTRAAERDDDDSPETERAPAPEAAPRMQPGYAFYTPSKRKGDWKKIPNDDWEHVVVGEDEIEKSDLVGMRLIDGSMHDIFEVNFAAGRGGRGYYAQLQTHTRGRGAAHEAGRDTKDLIDFVWRRNQKYQMRADAEGHWIDLGHGTNQWELLETWPREKLLRFVRGEFGYAGEGAVLLDHMANDFTSPKEAITHAQRSWGATHVDFHGTRNSPTVYGTKDGARWKKTLYKEKGKFHWPDKFAKGPKRLSGAIEISVTGPAPAPAPAPVPMRTPPMAPPLRVPPGRSGYLSEEARRRGPRALPRRIDQTELHQWSERDRSHVELRDKITGETIIEWRDDAVQDAVQDGFLDPRNLHASAFEYAVHVGLIKPQESWGPRRAARENPATDLQDAIPWVRVTRDPERYKEALARAQKIGPVDDARKVYELVGPALMKEDQETFIVVLIDVRQNCRGVAEIHRGARSRVATSVLDVMRVVVASGAEGFIVCHNHPSGKAMPSDADRDLTKAIERAAKPFKGETAFLDHVVCGSGEYFSFADNKLHKAKN